MKLTFLGTRGEIEARSPRHRRHSSLLISHHRRRVMLDCGADWLHQVQRIKPHAIVLTHAHPDHAYGLREGAPCPVWATAACWRSIRRFPIEARCTIRPLHAQTIEGIDFKAFTVEHSLLAPAVGYRIEAGNIAIFYVPDLVFIRSRRAALHGVRMYIGDGATLTRPLVRRRGTRLIGHAPITTQLTWCQKEGVARAWITHCGTPIVTARHTDTVARLRTLGKERGVDVHLASDGMSLRLR